SLPLTIDAQRLLVNLRSEPVVKKSGAATQSDAATLQRRPHPTEAWRDVELPRHVILKLVTHAVAERQVLAHAKVVLNIPAELILSILHGRIADALRELGRQSGFECIDIRELKSAEWIRSFVAAIAAGLELPAETKTMFLECIIDIVRKLDIKLPATATPLRAAVVERARNQNRA